MYIFKSQSVYITVSHWLHAHTNTINTSYLNTPITASGNTKPFQSTVTKGIPHILYYRMAKQINTSTYSPDQIYGDAGLIYIRYDAQIESKPNGQKNIGGSRPAFSNISTTHRHRATTTRS
ncbi:MAG: hypothetical protein ACKPKO_64285 [Candidatus Fonsibacter sp.]